MAITSESRAALEELKNIVRASIPAARIDAHAFRLVGEPRETIDDEAHDLYEALRAQSPPVPHGMAFGLAMALREVIRERIRGIEEGRA